MSSLAGKQIYPSDPYACAPPSVRDRMRAERKAEQSTPEQSGSEPSVPEQPTLMEPEVPPPPYAPMPGGGRHAGNSQSEDSSEALRAAEDARGESDVHHFQHPVDEISAGVGGQTVDDNDVQRLESSLRWLQWQSAGAQRLPRATQLAPVARGRLPSEEVFLNGFRVPASVRPVYVPPEPSQRAWRDHVSRPFLHRAALAVVATFAIYPLIDALVSAPKVAQTPVAEISAQPPTETYALASTPMLVSKRVTPATEAKDADLEHPAGSKPAPELSLGAAPVPLGLALLSTPVIPEVPLAKPSAPGMSLASGPAAEPDSCLLRFVDLSCASYPTASSPLASAAAAKPPPPAPKEAPSLMPVPPTPSPRPDAAELPLVPGSAELPPVPGSAELPPPPGSAELPPGPGPAELPPLPGPAELPAVRSVEPWPDARPAAAPVIPAAAAVSTPVNIDLLIKQGEHFLSVGDLVSARLAFQRAAEAGDAKAALALATTYDPAMIAKLGVRGITGEVEQARSWYQKAAELGSVDASRRLEQLTRR